MGTEHFTQKNVAHAAYSMVPNIQFLLTSINKTFSITNLSVNAKLEIADSALPKIDICSLRFYNGTVNQIVYLKFQ